MKFIFSFLLFIFITNASAFPGGVVITYNFQESWVKDVKRILKEEYSFPENVIKTQWQPRACDKLENFLLQICITDEGQMKVAFARRKEIQNAFLIFRKEI